MHFRQPPDHALTRVAVHMWLTSHRKEVTRTDMTTALMPTAAAPAQALSELFHQVFGPTYGPFQGWMAGSQAMLANVYEVGDAYQAAFLIPGIDPQSLQVTALGNTITVAGTRELAEPDGS